MTKKLYLVFIIIFLTQVMTLGTELTYKETLNTAIKNSFDLKISALDIGISKAQLKAVRADWYPNLSMQFNTEYNKDLMNGRGTFAYAGNTMITPYTQFRDMLYMTLSYNILDFGVQGKKVHIAKQDVVQKEINYNIQLRDLKLKILELYSKVEQHNNAINTKSEILSLYKNMFTNKERMYKAGMNDKLSVMDEAVKIAKTQNDIENSKLELKQALEDLSYYTKNDYEISNLHVQSVNFEPNTEPNIVEVSSKNIIETEINKTDYNLTFNSYLSDEAKYYDLEIDKKKSELSILKRQLLPTFRFYVGYSLYGQNPNNYYSSFQDMGQRSFVVGISSQYVFFDGFKNRANREKTKLEIEKLQVEKDKKLSELENKYKKSYKAYETYNEELDINNNLLTTVKEKLDDVGKLRAYKLADQNQLLSAKADLLSQEYELEQNIINITSKLEEMKIMSGADL